MGVPTWRQAAAADAPAIAALHAASWRTAYSAALSPAYLAGDIVAERLNFWAGRLAAPDRGSYIVLAEQDDRLLGFACAVAEGGATYGMKGAGLLDNLHVAQAFQGQGLGRRLLLEAAAWCHAVAHTDGLVLSVLQANRQAQRFYERQGAMRMGSLVWNAPDGAAVPCFLMGWTGPAWAALASLASRRPALSAVTDPSGETGRARRTTRTRNDSRQKFQKALQLLDRGALIQGEEVLRQLVNQSGSEGDAVALVQSLVCLGDLLHETGRSLEARPFLERALREGGCGDVLAQELDRARKLLGVTGTF